MSTVNTMVSVMSTRINNVVKGLMGGFKMSGTAAMYGTTLGRAAGENLEGIGAWGSYSYTDFENETVLSGYDGDRHSFLVGMDTKPRDNMVLGLALGYENTDIDTAFNGGELENEGFTVAPYFGMAIDDHWSMDITAGYSSTDTDQFRTLVGTTTRITSSTDSERWFGSANINYGLSHDHFYFEGRGGVLSANEEQDAYTESDNTPIGSSRTAVTQLQLGGLVTYVGHEQFQPFVGLTYNYDASVNRQELVDTNGNVLGDDDDDFLGSLGFRYNRDNLTAGLEWNRRFSREDLEEDSLNLDVRVDF